MLQTALRVRDGTSAQIVETATVWLIIKPELEAGTLSNVALGLCCPIFFCFFFPVTGKSLYIKDIHIACFYLRWANPDISDLTGNKDPRHYS